MIKFEERDKYGQCKGIYGIKNILNNKIYVGQTKQSFCKRYLLHDWQLRQNIHDNLHLQKAYNRYGENNFKFIIIAIIESDDINVFNNLEEIFIAKYKCLKLAYNILDGGGGRAGVPLSDHAKKIIGEKNRLHNIGKKASEETKRKMSESHKGKHIDRKTDIIDVNVAKQIKELLISGMKPIDIAKQLQIPYKIVNNIYSSNTWASVYVEGWDEFYNSRKRLSRLTPEEHKKIFELYNTNVLSIQELAAQYNRTVGAITHIIKKYTNNLDTRQSCAKS